MPPHPPVSMMMIFIKVYIAGFDAVISKEKITRK
jgi:hypothetical protein